MTKTTKLCAIAAVAVMMALSSPCRAMDLQLTETKAGGAILEMSGEIEEGDAANITTYITKNTDWIKKHKSFAITINSPGGLAMEAWKVADLFHDAGIGVVGKCASACFFIFANAKEKVLIGNARVGVHLANSKEDPKAALALSVISAKVLRNIGIPDDIIMDMLVTDSQDVHWLTADQLHRMSAVSIN